MFIIIFGDHDNIILLRIQGYLVLVLEEEEKSWCFGAVFSVLKFNWCDYKIKSFGYLIYHIKNQHKKEVYKEFNVETIS